MLGFAFSIKKIWKKYCWEKPDIIYTSTPDLFTAWKAEKFAKKHKLPCVVEVRDLWPLSIVEYKGFSNSNPAIRVLYSLEKKIYRRADALVFTMEGGKDYIKEKGWGKKVDLNKIFNLNNGIDISEQNSHRAENALSDTDLNNNNFKVIYAGSIRMVNAVDMLVKAAEILKEKEDVSFLIYGDGDMRGELECYCAEKGINSVKFKGRVDKKYIPYICSKANVNVISVKQTGVSEYGVSWNKLFDYMAAGKPILSTVKVNYDLIEKYDCGFSLDDQKPESIAEAVLKVYNMSDSEYARLCKNAENAAKDFDYSILTTKLEEVIDYAVEHYKR